MARATSKPRTVKKVSAPVRKTKTTTTTKTPRKAATSKAAKTAAETAAKTAPRANRQTGVKRVEKPMSATALKKLEQVKGMANSLCFCIRQDAKAASKGTVSIEKVRRMFKELQQSILDARMEMYRDS